MAYSQEGQQLAQIAQIKGPGGTDEGWMVWLTLRQGELFDHYPTRRRPWRLLSGRWRRDDSNELMGPGPSDDQWTSV